MVAIDRSPQISLPAFTESSEVKYAKPDLQPRKDKE